jgi:hypothetical protein
MQCIFCDNELLAATKPEHVLQAAAGGRMMTQRVNCSDCNETFGGTIDKDFGEQLGVLRNLLQFDSGTGKPPPILRRIKAGKDTLNFRSDGTPELIVPPFKVTASEEGTHHIQINVHTADQLQRAVTHIAAILGCSEEEIKKVIAAGEAKYISKRPDPIHFQVSFGGTSPLRAITKSCLVLWALRVGNEEVKFKPYEDARRFVQEGDEAFNTTRIHLDSRHLPCVDELVGDFGKFFSLIWVQSDAKGRVIAHFTLYNLMGWRIILAEHGATPDTRIGLISNPIDPGKWSASIADDVQIDSAWLDGPTLSLELARKRFEAAAMHHIDTTRSREVEMIADDVLRKFGFTQPDEIIPESKLDSVAGALANRLTLSLFNIPHEESLTADELAALLGSKEDH